MTHGHSVKAWWLATSAPIAAGAMSPPLCFVVAAVAFGLMAKGFRR